MDNVTSAGGTLASQLDNRPNNSRPPEFKASHQRFAYSDGARECGALTNESTEASTEDRKKGGLAAWQVRRVAQYIDEQLHGKLFTRVLASKVYLSEFHFCRAFRLSFGESPHAYVTRRRMEAAKKLLSTTSMPIGHIALECGAADQAHFTNLFRRCAGQTPGSWRRGNGSIS
jgi:AraC family transcriptional regulator